MITRFLLHIKHACLIFVEIITAILTIPITLWDKFYDVFIVDKQNTFRWSLSALVAIVFGIIFLILNYFHNLNITEPYIQKCYIEVAQIDENNNVRYIHNIKGERLFRTETLITRVTTFKEAQSALQEAKKSGVCP